MRTDDPAHREQGHPRKFQPSFVESRSRTPRTRSVVLWAAVAVAGLAVLATGAEDWFLDLLFGVIFVVASAPIADRIARQAARPGDGSPPRPRRPHLRVIEGAGGAEGAEPSQLPLAANGNGDRIGS